MENPFKVGQQYGEDLAARGWLEATYLNSTQQHQQDAEGFARNAFAAENLEDQRTVAAGIMQAWGRRRNWQY